jgi:hypothetical protein
MPDRGFSDLLQLGYVRGPNHGFRTDEASLAFVDFYDIDDYTSLKIVGSIACKIDGECIAFNLWDRRWPGEIYLEVIATSHEESREWATVGRCS